MFRSTPIPGLAWRAAIGGAVAVLVFVPLLGGIPMALLSLTEKQSASSLPSNWASAMAVIAFLLTFSPFYSVFGVVIATPFALLAARLGWAGWATAVLIAGTLGALVGRLLSESDMPAILGILSVGFALPYWLGARLFDRRIGGAG